MRYSGQCQLTTADDIKHRNEAPGGAWRANKHHLFAVILSRDIQYCRLHVLTFGLGTLHAFLS